MTRFGKSSSLALVVPWLTVRSDCRQLVSAHLQVTELLVIADLGNDGCVRRRCDAMVPVICAQVPRGVWWYG